MKGWAQRPSNGQQRNEGGGSHGDLFNANSIPWLCSSKGCQRRRTRTLLPGDHRMIEGGRHPCRPPWPLPLLKQVNKIWFPRTVSREFLEISSDGSCTTFLGNLCQGYITFTLKKGFPCVWMDLCFLDFLQYFHFSLAPEGSDVNIVLPMWPHQC